MVYLYFLYKETFIPAIARHLVLQLILFLTCVSAYQTTFKVLSETESVDGYSQLKLENGDVLVFRLNVPVVVDISEQSSFHPFKVSTDQYDPSNTPSEDVLNVVTTASTITYTLLQATTPLYYLCGVVGHNFRGVLIQQVTNQDAIVTVSTRTPAEADALTQQVINAGETFEFGALEATMSRVVDVASPAFVASAPSVPVMAKIQEIEYDAQNAAWTLKYETMKFTPDDILNHFHRILYFTQTGSDNGVSSGDLGNICIDRSTTNLECANHLTTHYTTNAPMQLDADSLSADGITVTVSDVNYSQKQEISITIPHEVIRNVIGTKSTYQHPDRGEQTSYKFGVGILFTPDQDQSKTRVIMFDVFQLTENSWQLFAVQQQISYSVAQYVSFWTSKAEVSSAGGGTEFVTTANVEFTLDSGHTVDTMDVTINGQSVTETMCGEMQDKINTLSDPSCIASYQLCTRQVISGNGGATWISVVYPISPASSQVDIDLLLKTDYLPPGAEVSKKTLSTLNFQTSQPASLMCQDTTIKAFDPIQYTKATVYRGTEVVIDDPSSSFFTIHNVSSAVSLPESLITLVIGPDETSQAATNYFARFGNDVIELDELYMSHALNPDNLPDTVDNKIYGTAEGRSYIVLDSGLVQGCMLEDNDAFTYQKDAFECVTTKDWPPTERQKSSGVGTYFVHKVSSEGQAQAKEWLKKYITGTSDGGDTEATAILSRTLALQGATNKNSIYYIWPVYFWPDSSPVGLKDHTLISLSWSVFRTASRRLLSVGHAYASSVGVYSKLTKKNTRPMPTIKPIVVFDTIK